ncbi:MAG: hypothetical protein AAF384_18505 [Pseudomonadota bacterium]
MPFKWLATIVGAAIIPPLLVILPPTAPANSLLWDALMLAGYVGCSAMVLLPIVSARGWERMRGAAYLTRVQLRVHRYLAWAFVVCVVIHALGLFVIDPNIIRYLYLSAPLGMLCALIGTLLLAGLMFKSELRRFLPITYPRWLSWHNTLSILVLAFTFVHLIESDYYLNAPIKVTVLCVLVFFPSFELWRRVRGGRRDEQPATTAGRTAAVARHYRLFVLVAIGALALTIVFLATYLNPTLVDPCNTPNCLRWP